MASREGAEVVDWANLIPAMAMALFWLAPMTLFWGIVFGPLRPMDAPRTNLAPTLPEFFAWSVMSLSPGLLPRSYYRVGISTRARRVYELLGVRRFKRFVVNGDLVNRVAKRRDPRYRVLTTRDDLAMFVERTCSVEKAHLTLMAFSLFTAFHAARIGWFGWAGILAAGNLIGNVYPVLLQRYNRARAEHVMRS
jgi:hypothetical protein